MNFWTNPENTPIKVLLGVLVVGIAGYFAFTYMHGNALEGKGSVLSTSSIGVASSTATLGKATALGPIGDCPFGVPQGSFWGFDCLNNLETDFINNSGPTSSGDGAASGPSGSGFAFITTTSNTGGGSTVATIDKSGNTAVNGTLMSQGKLVCLKDGTNCPSSSGSSGLWAASGSDISSTNSGNVGVGTGTGGKPSKLSIMGADANQLLSLWTGGSTIWHMGVQNSSGDSLQFGDGATMGDVQLQIHKGGGGVEVTHLIVNGDSAPGVLGSNAAGGKVIWNPKIPVYVSVCDGSLTLAPKCTTSDPSGAEFLSSVVGDLSFIPGGSTAYFLLDKALGGYITSHTTSTKTYDNTQAGYIVGG